MTLASLNFSALVDLGFVLLVSGACIRSLTSTPIDAEKIAQRWRTELQELERVLRQLITEASTASTNLDHRLMRRKFELETLLKRLENAKGTAPAQVTGTQTAVKAAAAPQSSKSASQKAAQPPKVTAEDEWKLGTEEEFPNQSWMTDETESFESGLGHLEDLVESAEDTLQIATQIATQAIKPTAARTPSKPPVSSASKTESKLSDKRSLAAQIEAIRSAAQEETDLQAERTFKQLNIMDPTAYRIARRLLASGGEIHVVARKLDLPVSEVRLLDRLMREETTKDGKGEPPHRQTEIVPANKIVRSEQKRKPAAPAARQTAPLASMLEREVTPAVSNAVGEQDLDQIIERELALL